jgi:carboxymethylenebutenolidase
MAAATRAAGGVPDDQCIGDIEGCMHYLRTLPYHSGKIGIIGSARAAGRPTSPPAGFPSLDAAVDCWGGGVTAPADQLTPRQPVAPDRSHERH